MFAVRDLRFAYSRRHDPVIDELSHEFPASAITAVTGPSGCGKSTLLYLLALMLRPASGEIVYEDRVVSRLSDGQRSRLRAATVGFVFQDAVLDPARSVTSNVYEGSLYAGMTTSSSRDRAGDLLTRFGVEHRADHRPGEISGGQAQRVALCRALVKRPRLVLGDEPTGNLDHASAEVVWQALIEAAHDGGATVVVATHDRQLAARADHVLTLRTAGGQ